MGWTRSAHKGSAYDLNLERVSFIRLWVVVEILQIIFLKSSFQCVMVIYILTFLFGLY